jgi:hypothetical protein
MFISTVWSRHENLVIYLQLFSRTADCLKRLKCYPENFTPTKLIISVYIMYNSSQRSDWSWIREVRPLRLLNSMEKDQTWWTGSTAAESSDQAGWTWEETGISTCFHWQSKYRLTFCNLYLRNASVYHFTTLMNSLPGWICFYGTYIVYLRIIGTCTV